ncbi:MAG: hypothetical protein MK194_16145, partial [Roseibacillus sp.]|nr:hypothetical protein [Roseibacillus sp.]
LWGSTTFEVQADEYDVLIKGELREDLKNIEGSEVLLVSIDKEGNDENGYPKRVYRLNPTKGVISNAVKKGKSYKLKPKWVKEKREREKKKKNGEVEKGEDGKPKMEEYWVKVDKSREHLRGALVKCKGPLERKRDKKQKVRDYQEFRQPLAKELYDALKVVAPDDYLTEYRQGFFQNNQGRDQSYGPKIIQCAEELLKFSDPGRARGAYERQVKSVISSVRLGLKVWTMEKKKNEMHLLFQAKAQ